MTEKYNEQNSCLVEPSVEPGKCEDFEKIHEDMVISLGPATAQAATIAGNRVAKENGTCVAYEIYQSFEKAVGPITAIKMFGKGYGKYCPCDLSQFI